MTKRLSGFCLLLCLLFSSSCFTDKSAFKGLSKALPDFTLIAAPNELEVPGRIFAIDQQGIPQPITSLIKELKVGTAVISKVEGRTSSSISALLGFLGGSANSSNRYNKTIIYKLQINGCTQERLDLLEMERALKKVTPEIIAFNKKYHLSKFYVVTEAVKATKLNYTFDVKSATSLGLKADLDRIVQANQNVKWSDDVNLELNYELERPLYVYAKYFLLKLKDDKVVVEQAVASPNPIYQPARINNFYSVLYQQLSPEFKALCYQSYNIARMRLDMALGKPHEKPLAIVTDVDETILDNTRYEVNRILANKEFDEASWGEWVSRGIADSVPGAPSFFQYAASKGVEVFYITNRGGREKEGTISNLKKLGYPFIDEAHIKFRENTSVKQLRREPILAQYDVVLLIGDNLADFNALFDKRTLDERNRSMRSIANDLGDKFILIPNVQYGDWEQALFGYNYRLTAAEKDSIMRANAKGY